MFYIIECWMYRENWILSPTIFCQRYLYCQLSHHALRYVWVSTYVWPNTLVAHETFASDQLYFSAFSTLEHRACGCLKWKMHMCGFHWDRVFMSNQYSAAPQKIHCCVEIRLSQYTCGKDLITRYSQVRLYKLVRLFTYRVRKYNLGILNSHLQILLSAPKKISPDSYKRGAL